MADDSTDTGTSTDDQQQAGQDGGAAQATAAADDRKFTQADLDRIVADRVSRERSKFADYGDLKKKAAAAMTEQERAVAEAEQRGETAALSKTAGRLARAEFRAAAAGLVDKDTLDAYLEDADLSKFVGADGEPDTKAIEARIKRLGGTERRTDFDGGARSSAAKPTDMNQLIRQRAGLG
jgi:hypothetical protein